MSKVPPRTIPSDSCAVALDGEIFFPHEGESVTFRGLSSIGDLALSMRLTSVDWRNLTADELREIGTLMVDTLNDLAERIVEWDWTNNDGGAYPSPPTFDVLRGLSVDEVTWLIKASATALKPEPASAVKNASSSSRGPSTARRSNRRRNG